MLVASGPAPGNFTAYKPVPTVAHCGVIPDELFVQSMQLIVW